MEYTKYNNETQVPILLEKIYKKLAGDSAEKLDIDTYDNSTKVPILLSNILENVEAEEGGSGGAGVFVVNINFETKVADKTLAEIFSAMEAGKIVKAKTTLVGLVANPVDIELPLVTYTDSSVFFSGIMWTTNQGTPIGLIVSFSMQVNLGVRINVHYFNITEMPLG